MKQQLELLYELQLADSGLDERRKALKGLDDGSAARAELAQAEEKLAKLEKRLHDDQTTMRDKELRLATTEEDRAQRHERAYGGRVSDTKQLAALEKKIEELTALKGKLEEEILLLMDSIEEQSGQVAAAQAEVDRLRARAEDLEAHYRMDRERLQKEAAELKTRREELAPQVPAQLMQAYDQLRQRLGGVAVAAVEDLRCGGCHMSVPRDAILRIGDEEIPVRCENCHRILWVPKA